MVTIYVKTPEPDYEKETDYENRSDVCSVCGKRGGMHFTDFYGRSWCYDKTTRRRAKKENKPWYFTRFTYPTERMKPENPNRAFKKEVLDAKRNEK
jgi:hypothetical protein